MEAGRGAFWEFVRSDLPDLLERYPQVATFAKPAPAPTMQLLATLGVTVSIDRLQSAGVTVARLAS